MFPFDSGNQLVKTDIDYLVASPCVTIDMINSRRFYIDMVSNITYLNIINPYEGAEIIICFAQDTVGGRVVTNWLFTSEFGVHSTVDSSIIRWQNDTPLILSMSAGKLDYAKIVYNKGKFSLSSAPNF